MDDRDVLLIEEYIQAHEYKPEIKPDMFLFDMHSYSNFAMHEILNRVIRESMKLPAHITGKETLSVVEIIEIFIDEMDYFSNLAHCSKAKEMFDTARDEAKCMLMFVCSSQRKENVNE